SQIDVLNEDYRAQNSDLSDVPGVWNNLIADCEIQFALAERTPNGFETNGITRTETTVTNWNGSDNVKYTSLGGHDAWPNTMYLNIWVCNIGGGLLGYAYQPGINPSLDGLVIGYRFFGTEGNISSTYNLGRTATHEIGHYFNLDHLWGPGGTNTNCNASDYVSDTPVQEDANYGCETFPHVSCSNGPNGDMFNNFMDYGDDDCVIFFTEGQKSRMLAALNGPRSALKTSNGLTPPGVGIEDHELAGSLLVYPNPSKDVVRIQLDQGNGVISDIRMMNLLGESIIEETNVKLGSAAHALDVSQLPAGVYVLEINSDKERISRKINILN
ncbi:MAG: M43 family zinc metalloprotease, partial [Flavobacteriales bacterium]|nr:M43 family zinc metalloprotease [Flavobacteriales bacterium]